MRPAEKKNFKLLSAAFKQEEVAIVLGILHGKPVPVICALCNGDASGQRPSYAPFAILVNEYTTDLLNDLVPPPSLHGEWCWTHVPQKDPPPPLVPQDGESNEAGEPA